MPFDGSDYIARPTRSLAEMRADVMRQLTNKRAELRIALDRDTEDGAVLFTPRQRSLYREIAALRRRLSIVEVEIVQRQRAA